MDMSILLSNVLRLLLQLFPVLLAGLSFTVGFVAAEVTTVVVCVDGAVTLEVDFVVEAVALVVDFVVEAVALVVDLVVDAAALVVDLVVEVEADSPPRVITSPLRSLDTAKNCDQ